MQAYHDMLRYIQRHGEEREDRTGTGTISVFGYQNRHDLRKGFPLLTTKEMNFEKIAGETLWMLSGSTNAEECAEKFGFKIWRKWANDNGELGPIYGKQWRAWDNTHDQIKDVIQDLKDSPFSRRHVVSAWHVGELEDMSLPPCHLLFQFYVTNEGRLNLQLYQRSADAFLGVPFNIAGYAFIQHIVAHLTGYSVGEFIHTFGDLHIYMNHIEQVDKLLKREPRSLPVLKLDNNVSALETFYDEQWRDHFILENYHPHEKISARVSV